MFKDVSDESVLLLHDSAVWNVRLSTDDERFSGNVAAAIGDDETRRRLEKIGIVGVSLESGRFSWKKIYSELLFWLRFKSSNVDFSHLENFWLKKLLAKTIFCGVHLMRRHFSQPPSMEWRWKMVSSAARKVETKVTNILLKVATFKNWFKTS